MHIIQVSEDIVPHHGLKGLQSYVQSHMSSSTEEQSNTESVDECPTHVSIIPCPVVPSHRLDKFLPTAKIAFGTGMQYGP